MYKNPLKYAAKGALVLGVVLIVLGSCFIKL